MTSTTPEKKPGYISQSRIKDEFGLTDAQIRSLGEPDATRPNPHYRSGPPMKLYLQQRVEQWIAEHESEITASLSRKQAAQRSVRTKREAAKAEIAKLVRRLELAPIISRARVRKDAAASGKGVVTVTEYLLISIQKGVSLNSGEPLRCIS